MERLFVSGSVPAEFVALGERAPVVDPKEKCNSYGFWGNFQHQLRLQHRWDHEVSKAEIERYRKGDGEITLGETTHRTRSNVTVGATEHATFPWPANEPVPWKVFDKAGTLTRLTYHGRDTGVIQYVASRKPLSELSWYDHGQSSS